MAGWKQRREIRHGGCEGRGWRKQFKWRYIDMMVINHMKFSWREIENFIGLSLFLRNKGSERVCMFLGASPLSSGSFPMKPPPPPTPHNGGGGGRLPHGVLLTFKAANLVPRVFRLFGKRLKAVNRGNFFLWNPESRFYWLGIRNPSLYGQEIWNPVLGIWNLQTGIQNPRLSWITLHGLIRNTFCNKSSPYFDMLA